MSGTPHIQFAIDQVKCTIHMLHFAGPSVVQIIVLCWVVTDLWAWAVGSEVFVLKL